MDSSVCAILVKRNGRGGAVRKFGKEIDNLVTGPKEDPGYFIVVIQPGESCRLFGQPDVRFFYRC